MAAFTQMYTPQTNSWVGIVLAVAVSAQAVDVSYEEGNPLGAHAGFRVEPAVEGSVSDHDFFLIYSYKYQYLAEITVFYFYEYEPLKHYPGS